MGKEHYEELSVPLFIGEWIVTPAIFTRKNGTTGFQSPIHRGMDCNHRAVTLNLSGFFYFQSPIHRGMDCNNKPSPAGRDDAELSVPYSSGNGL